MQKKKKKTVNLAWIIGGIVVIAGIGTIAYWTWPKNDSAKNAEQPVNVPNNTVQNLQTQLSQIKQKLNQLTNPTQKSQITSQITDIEKQLKQISQLNNSQQKQTIQQLEQKIKAIKQELGLSDKPDKNDNPSPTPPNQETPPPPPNNEENDCPYNEKSLTETSSNNNMKLRMDEKELEKWRLIPRDYIVELWKKGYHWIDILQLWEWKIPETDIPNLKAESRVGVIEELFYIVNMDKFVLNIPEVEREKIPLFVGGNKSLVVIRRKIPNGGPKINLDKGIQTAAFGDDSNTRKYAEKVIKFAFQQESINFHQYEVSLLCAVGVKYFGKERKVAGGISHGKSFGSAIYLALLSALHQKPISKKVAATGALAIREKTGKMATYQDREEKMKKEVQKTEQELVGTKTNSPNQTKTIKRLEKELEELKQKESKLKAQIEQEKKINPLIKGEETQLAAGTNLPISGLREKVSGAYENGINIFVLSKYNSAPYLLWQKLKDEQNKGEWVLSSGYQLEVPDAIKNGVTVHLTENVKELRELLTGGQLS